jgi:two-component sensor histidine kinase
MRRRWTAATGLLVATARLRHSCASSIKTLKVIAGVTEGDRPESHNHWRAALFRRAAFEGGTDHGSEIRYRRKDGSVFWAAIFVSSVLDENGVVVQHFASFVDLTRQKREQAQSTMMINELNHRVKNTLATVQSIVWQALRRDSDPKTIREAIESRLFALSRSHDLLTREHWESARLLDLVKAAMEPFGVANGGPERLVITGKNIRLSPNVALALGIAFHELATNAVKYGALSNEAGSVLLTWTLSRYRRATVSSCAGRRGAARPSHRRPEKVSARALLNAVCPTSCKARQISTTAWTAWSARSTFLHRGDRHE